MKYLLKNFIEFKKLGEKTFRYCFADKLFFYAEKDTVGKTFIFPKQIEFYLFT